MYEILKAIAAAQGWGFDYGRKDFHNLYEAAEQKGVSHIFLDPVKIKDIDNDEGVTEKKQYSGSFMVVFSSDVDEKSYEDRYEDYIKPNIKSHLKTVKDEIRCGYEVVFDSWETVEVINALDYNFDGVICTYKVTIDV